MAFEGKWKRSACCPVDQIPYPSPPENLMSIILSGYIYKNNPTWYTETGQQIIPLSFSFDMHNLSYVYDFYYTGRETNYYLSTSDDIKPVVLNNFTKEPLKINKVSKHNGYVSWQIFL